MLKLMNYIIALDAGTSSTRAMIYSIQGQCITSCQYPITQYYPQPGWVEHDAEEIWNKSLSAMRAVLEKVPAGSVIACGITNQRETTVIWNKATGACLAPAIVWQDRRTEEFCASLTQHSAMIRNKTGLITDPYFSATKVRWLLQNNDKAQKLAEQNLLAFGTIDSYLIWKLTQGKEHVTDCTNASRTMLFNIHDLQWDDGLLDLFSIPKNILPEVKPCDSHFGTIDKSYFGFDLPITGVAGDQQAALIGQACVHEGMVKSTFGTGAFLMMNTGSKAVLSQHKLLTTIAYQIKGVVDYALEGSIYHAGTAVKWLRDELKIISNASETETLASSLPSNGGVYFVSAFSGLGAPYWLSTNGAFLSGLSCSTGRAHIARAVLEGVCYQTRAVTECMRNDSGMDLSLMRVDGGMSVNPWFLQFLADQCQLLVQKPLDIETTSRGVALLAAMGCGAIESIAQLETSNPIEKEFIPQRSHQEVAREYDGWEKALKQVMSR